MNKESLYRISKMSNKDKLVIVKYGNFYKSFDEDAIILHNLFGYKVIDNKASFPLSCFNKVISLLMRNGISVVVIKNEMDIINYDSTSLNMYENVRNESVKKYDFEKLVEELRLLIYSKLEEDTNNYGKLVSFINSL